MTRLCARSLPLRCAASSSACLACLARHARPAALLSLPLCPCPSVPACLRVSCIPSLIGTSRVRSVEVCAQPRRREQRTAAAPSVGAAPFPQSAACRPAACGRQRKRAQRRTVATCTNDTLQAPAKSICASANAFAPIMRNCKHTLHTCRCYTCTLQRARGSRLYWRPPAYEGLDTRQGAPFT